MSLWWIFFGQAVLAILLGLGALYLKGLPDRLHQEGVKRFEFALNSKLEVVKADLSREIEMAKISQAGLQVHKTEEFTRLVEFFIDALTNPEQFKTLAANPEAAKEFNRRITDLGLKLFFFASDATVKSYVAFRLYGMQADSAERNTDPTRLIVLLAELVVSMRRDLGYSETECSVDEVLNIMLTDWEQKKPIRSGIAGADLLKRAR